VWTDSLFRQLFPGPAFPFKPLPKKASLRVSFRRTTRQGAVAGTPVEDLGVSPDAVHLMTRADLIEGNVDLITAAAAILAGMPVRSIALQAGTRTGGHLPLRVTTGGLDRIDVAVDGRPVTSLDVTDGTTNVDVPVAAGAKRLAVDGYSHGTLAARTSTDI
jgi:hypothetical protein